MAVVQLGDFVLDEVIGRGGMGEIWRARHSALGTPVAVKVDLHPPDAAYAAAFLHEVQLVASLDHPHVVKILDHGAVTEHASSGSDGGLKAGSRWLAMELAAGGALADRPPRNWAEVRHVMEALLAGLAHAHSRGLVHRDIKAGNLLIAGPEPGIAVCPSGLLDARLVLSDFGISGRAELDANSAAGTPKLMAPEQIRGHWRDQGPWTDLYAVGILLWRMLTGRYPFTGKNSFQIVKQHLSAPLPPFRPRMGTPPGVERLLHRLLSKDPRQRLPFAADVQAELEALGEARGDVVSTVMLDEATEQTTRHTDSTGGTSMGAALSRFEGAGVSMWGLRSPPLVGRDAACTALLAALGRVEAQRRARLAIVRGASGTGRTRMGQWIAGQAHASGRAFVFDAAGTATEEEPLVEMVRRAIRAEGLSGTELVDRVHATFPNAPFDLKALVALLAPEVQAGPTVRGAWRHVLVQAALTALVRDRVGVVVLDDAHLARDFLPFADQVLSAQGLRPSPLLLVLTVRDEALDDEAAEAVTDLLDDPATSVVQLHALNPLEHQRLIRGLVGLSGTASAAIEDHTRGNPLFAVQLIDAWLQQGVLHPTSDGLSLTRDPGLPKGLLDVWRARVDTVLEGLSEREVLTIDVAAALGQRVETSVWRKAVEVLGGAPVEPVIALLARRHWARTAADQEHVTFVHTLLLQALTNRAQRAGRWGQVNTLAADALSERAPRQAERIAKMRVEAGELESSLPLFARAMEIQIEQGDLRRDHNLVAMGQVLAQLNNPAGNPWTGRLEVVRATRMRMRGQADEAAELLASVVEAATRHHWTTERGRALRELARCRLALGDFDATGEAAQQALEHFLAAGDRMRAADCQKILADSASRRGDFATARALFEACAATYAALSPDELYTVMFALALLERRAGRPEVARHYLARCRAVVEPVGWQGALGSIANLEGELARDLGDTPAAIAAYAAAGESFRACDSPEYTYPILNIGLLDLESDRYASAVQRVLPVRAFATEKGLAMVTLYADLVLMAGYAGLHDTEQAAAALQRVEDFVTQRELADPDVGKLCAKAGCLFGRDHLELAFRASMVAHAQYTKCGRQAKADEVASFMGELQG